MSGLIKRGRSSYDCIITAHCIEPCGVLCDRFSAFWLRRLFVSGDLFCSENHRKAPEIYIYIYIFPLSFCFALILFLCILSRLTVPLRSVSR